MKTVSNLILVALIGVVMLFTTSCEKEPIELSYDTIYYTHYVFTDTVEVMLDAKYIDTTKWKGAVSKNYDDLSDQKFIYHSAYETLVLDDKSIQYLGGVKNSTPLPFKAPKYQMLNGNVYLCTDTVYTTRYDTLSYAIFEITDGDRTFTDTSFYFNNGRIKRQQDIFGENLEHHYVEWWAEAFDYYNYSKTDFETLQLTVDGREVYMLCVFPYWAEFDKPGTSLIYYLN